MQYDTIIIGGGPAGLATAWYAAQAGRRVAVFERNSVLGGMASSEMIDGVRVDAGSHRLHPAIPTDILDELQKLLGEDLQVRHRNGRVRLHNKWLRFPLHAGELLRSTPPLWVANVLRDAIISTSRRFVVPASTTSPTSYAHYLRTSLGPTAYDALYGPYAYKLWGVPGEAIDPEQARVRVSADSLTKVVSRIISTSIKSLRSTSKDNKPAARGTTFLYPRRGFGQITEAIADAARAAGAEIYTNVEVCEIDTSGKNEVQVVTRSGEIYKAEHILSTIPLPILTRIVKSTIPEKVTDAAASLRLRAMVLVYLTHSPYGNKNRAQWTPYDAHYLPDSTTPITRISEPTNYRDSTDDPIEKSVICAEIPCEMGDDIWESSDEDLQSITLTAMKSHELPLPQVSNVTIRRLPAVYPVYTQGYAKSLAVLEDWAAALPGVTTLGRGGLFAHDNTHHALIMAKEAAECIEPSGAFNDKRWRVSREKFRDHVVED